MANSVSGTTLIGVVGKPPFERGNCFSVLASDGEQYKIVNFNYENLKHCIDNGIRMPMQIKALDARRAVLHDSRIPPEFYARGFCEVCCPVDLLPLPQLLAREREIDNGTREEIPAGNGRIVIVMHRDRVPSIGTKRWRHPVSSTTS